MAVKFGVLVGKGVIVGVGVLVLVAAGVFVSVGVAVGAGVALNEHAFKISTAIIKAKGTVFFDFIYPLLILVNFPYNNKVEK